MRRKGADRRERLTNRVLSVLFGLLAIGVIVAVVALLASIELQ